MFKHPGLDWYIINYNHNLGPNNIYWVRAITLSSCREADIMVMSSITESFEYKYIAQNMLL